MKDEWTDERMDEQMDAGQYVGWAEAQSLAKTQWAILKTNENGSGHMPFPISADITLMISLLPALMLHAHFSMSPSKYSLGIDKYD